MTKLQHAILRTLLLEHAFGNTRGLTSYELGQKIKPQRGHGSKSYAGTISGCISGMQYCNNRHWVKYTKNGHRVITKRGVLKLLEWGGGDE
jgi:hypothetical protein